MAEKISNKIIHFPGPKVTDVSTSPVQSSEVSLLPGAVRENAQGEIREWLSGVGEKIAKATAGSDKLKTKVTKLGGILTYTSESEESVTTVRAYYRLDRGNPLGYDPKKCFDLELDIKDRDLNRVEVKVIPKLNKRDLGISIAFLGGRSIDPARLLALSTEFPTDSYSPKFVGGEASKYLTKISNLIENSAILGEGSEIEQSPFSSMRAIYASLTGESFVEDAPVIDPDNVIPLFRNQGNNQ